MRGDVALDGGYCTVLYMYREGSVWVRWVGADWLMRRLDGGEVGEVFFGRICTPCGGSERSFE